MEINGGGGGGTTIRCKVYFEVLQYYHQVESILVNGVLTVTPSGGGCTVKDIASYYAQHHY